MSAALETMTADEQAMLRQMQQDDAANPMPPPDPAGPLAETAPEAPAPEAPVEPERVDKRALDAERERRKKAEKVAAELQTKHAAELARAQTRLEMLASAAQAHIDQAPAAPRAEPKPAPDWATDPIGAIKHTFDEFENRQQAVIDRLARVETGNTQLTQAQQQMSARADLQSWANAQEAAFAAEKPDYQAAMTHLMQAERRAKLAIGVDESEVMGQLTNEIVGLAQMVRQRGKNFGETLYELAESRGYKPSAAANDAAPPSARAAVNAESAAERLLRGQDMATTLGSTGGAPRGEAAPQHIAQMSEEEFTRFYDTVKKKGPSALRGLFGE